MVYTPLTRLAMEIAYHAHENQKDKLGYPYIFHPIHLAEQMETELKCVVALLHDVVEASGMTFEQLANFGIPERALDALKLLTHERGVPYMDYVRALAADPIARQVKLADLRHNSDPVRLARVGDSTRERLTKKYEPAIRYLESYDATMDV